MLSEPWVAVVSIPGDPGLAVPIWITVDGESILMVTPPTSEKARAVEAAGAAWVTVHNEEHPYRYVSAEGPAAVDPDVDVPALMRELAVRYFGAERGEEFAREWLGQGTGDVAIRITPRRWRSFDEARIEA